MYINMSIPIKSIDKSSGCHKNSAVNTYRLKRMHLKLPHYLHITFNSVIS